MDTRCPGSALESECSLWEGNLEPQITSVLREPGIGLVSSVPLGRGFLTGEVKRAEEYLETDFRRHDALRPAARSAVGPLPCFVLATRGSGEARDLPAAKPPRA